jgi:hypothetical protein
MLRYGHKEYKRFREFLRDQDVLVFFLWLFLIPVFLLLLPFPKGAAALLDKTVFTAEEWHLLLLTVLHILGTTVLSALASLAVITVGCAVIWLSMLAREIEGIPESGAKFYKLTLKERLGKYIDFRGFD